MVSEAKGHPDIHDRSTVGRRKYGERTKETRAGVTHLAGSNLKLGYNGLSEP